MAKYYVLKKEAGKHQLLEVLEAKTLTEARKTAVTKHLNIVLSTQTQLIVVGKAGYEQYYKDYKEESTDGTTNFGI